MKSYLISVAGILILGAISFGAYRQYREFKVSVCEEVIIKSLTRQYGEMPADKKDEISQLIKDKCRQLLN